MPIVNGYAVGLGELGSWEAFHAGSGFVLVRQGYDSGPKVESLRQGYTFQKRWALSKDMRIRYLV